MPLAPGEELEFDDTEYWQERIDKVDKQIAALVIKRQKWERKLQQAREHLISG